MKNKRIGTSLLELLPIVADQQWYVYSYGRIRNQKGECPLCAVINEIEGSYINTNQPLKAIQYSMAYQMTAAEESQIYRIMGAADYQHCLSPKIRQYMLDTLKPIPS